MCGFAVAFDARVVRAALSSAVAGLERAAGRAARCRGCPLPDAAGGNAASGAFVEALKGDVCLAGPCGLCYYLCLFWRSV